jgi:hypothetical protein
VVIILPPIISAMNFRSIVSYLIQMEIANNASVGTPLLVKTALLLSATVILIRQMDNARHVILHSPLLIKAALQLLTTALPILLLVAATPASLAIPYPAKDVNPGLSLIPNVLISIIKTAIVDDATIGITSETIPFAYWSIHSVRHTI